MADTSMVQIVLLSDADARLHIIRNIVRWDAVMTSGEKIAIMALSCPKIETANVIGIWDKDVFKGAASYRYEDDKVKLLNIGVIDQKKGYGTAMVNWLKTQYPDIAQWCYTVTPKWCEKIGMTFVEKLSDGRSFYKWEPHITKH